MQSSIGKHGVAEKALSSPPIKARGWLDRIARLTRFELKPLIARYAAAVPRNERRRILVYSPLPWREGCVEYLLTGALKMRGHEVLTAICGESLPDCENHFYDFARPACDRCRVRAQRFCRAFGIHPLVFTRYLTDEDVAESERLTVDLGEKELRAMEYDSIPVGDIAYFQLNILYQTFLIELDDRMLEQLRTLCQAAILLTKACSRLLDRTHPDVAVCCNGKAFAYRLLFLQARRRGIPVVTWMVYPFDNTSPFVFSHNRYAGEIHLEDVWPAEKQRVLSAAQTELVTSYFTQWQKGDITPFEYHRNTRRDSGYVYQQLGLRRGQTLIACFPNMLRDTSAFDRDIGFSSLIDWVIQMARYAARRPDLHLVVRAHPAERCLPERYGKYNRFFVCPEVRRNVSPLPGNVHLLEGDTQLSSYALMREADVICVYSSTLGVEAALEGRLACVMGETHYRDKGFTKDIVRAQELWDFLDSGPAYPRTISEEEVELARRYAYLWRFRHPIWMQCYDAATMEFHLDSWNQMAPGANRTIDRLCECLVSGEPLIDVAATDREPGNEGRNV